MEHGNRRTVYAYIKMAFDLAGNPEELREAREGINANTIAHCGAEYAEAIRHHYRRRMAELKGHDTVSRKEGLDLYFDTETTGKADFKSPPSALHQPYLVQIGAALVDPKTMERVGAIDLMVQPDTWTIPEAAAAIHGISTDQAKRCGLEPLYVLSAFNAMCLRAERLVAFNIDYDVHVMTTFADRLGKPHRMDMLERRCVMKEMAPVCKIPKTGAYAGNPRDPYKWPRLEEAYRHCFGEPPAAAHNALADVESTIAIVGWLEDQLPKEAAE